MSTTLSIQVTTTPVLFTDDCLINLDAIAQKMQIIIISSSIANLQSVFDEIETQETIAEIKLTNDADSSTVTYTSLTAPFVNCTLSAIQGSNDSNTLVIEVGM